MTTKREGFTLVEVLIGMSLLSIMMVLLFASLRICVQNWNAGEKKIAQVGQAAIVQNFFQTKLLATLPLQADFLEEKQFSFQGNKNQLQFVASMPASAGRLGLQLFTMSLREAKDQEGQELLVDIKPFFPKDELDEWENEQVVILDKIESVKFAYYGADEFLKDAEWQDEWEEKAVLPRLVSMDVELINGDRWPQLIIDLKVNADGKGMKQGAEDAFGIVGGEFVNK